MYSLVQCFYKILLYFTLMFFVLVFQFQTKQSVIMFFCLVIFIVTLNLIHINYQEMYQNIQLVLKAKKQDQWIQDSIKLDNITSQDLDIDIVYAKVNQFIQKNKIKDSMYMYSYIRDKISIFKKDIQFDINQNCTNSFTIYIASKENIQDVQKVIRELQAKISSSHQRINKYLEDSRSIQNGNEVHVGIFYTEPIQKDHKQTEPQVLPVTYQREIHNIQNRINKNQQLTIKYKVATTNNLVEMLQAGVTVLHISCHGSKIYLQFQSSSKDGRGMLQQYDIQHFRTIFHSVFKIGGKAKKPKVFFINACHSGNIAFELFKLGVQNTIGINFLYPILNEASEKFTCKFYECLIQSRASVKSAFDDSVLYVRNEFLKNQVELYCCCKTHGYGSKPVHKPNCIFKNIIYPTSCGLHNLPKCSCPNRKFCLHLNTCGIVQNIPQNYKRFQKSNQQSLICCCDQIHDESQKFILFCPDPPGKNTIFQNICTDNKIDNFHEQYFKTTGKLKGRFYKDNKKFSINLQLFCSTSKNIVFIIGKQGIGKTSYVRKLISYYIQRSEVKELVQIDCKDYYNVTDLQLNFRVSRKRTNRSYNMMQMIEYFKEQKNSLLVFDHCDKIFQSCNKQFILTIQTIRQKLPRTKIIVALTQLQTTDEIIQKFKDRVQIYLTNACIFDMIYDRLSMNFKSRYQNKNKLQKLGLFNMRKMIKKIEENKYNNVQILIQDLQKEKEQLQKKKKQIQNTIKQLKSNRLLYIDILILSIFKRGLISCEEEIIQYSKILTHSIQQIKNVQIVSKITDHESKSTFKFQEQWYNYAFQNQHEFILVLFQNQQAEKTLVITKIFKAMQFYINSLISTCISKKRNFCLKQFHLSPFHDLPKESSFPVLQIRQQWNHYIGNIRSFLELNVKIDNFDVMKIYRDCLVNIPFLIQLCQEQKTAFFIHLCMNRMNLIENLSSIYEGRLRLCYQLNRNLKSTNNLEQSFRIINENLIQKNSPSGILGIERVTLILQQCYFLSDGCDEKNIKILKSRILKQINKIQWKVLEQDSRIVIIYTFIGAMILKLSQNYDAEIFLFQHLQKIINQIKEHKDSQDVLYYKQKILQIYFNLKILKLNSQKHTSTKQFKVIKQEIIKQDLTYYLPISKTLQNIQKIIHQKSLNTITIFTSNHLGYIVEGRFVANETKNIRYHRFIIQQLKKELQSLQKIIFIKSSPFTKTKLRASLDEGSLVQVLILDVHEQLQVRLEEQPDRNNKSYYVVFQENNRVGQKLSFQRFVQQFSFQKIKVLILSGYLTKKLQQNLQKRYPQLFIITIQKQNYQLKKSIYQFYEQEQIFSKYTELFVSSFCKQLISDQCNSNYYKKVLKAFNFSKHNTIKQLINVFPVIKKGSSLLQYLSVSTCNQMLFMKMANTVNFDEGPQVKFLQGNVVNLCKNEQRFQTYTHQFISISQNKNIYQVLHNWNQSINIINFYGSQHFGEVISREVLRTLIQLEKYNTKLITFGSTEGFSSRLLQKQYVIVENASLKQQSLNKIILQIINSNQNVKTKILLITEKCVFSETAQQKRISTFPIEVEQNMNLLYGYAYMRKRYNYIHQLEDFVRFLENHRNKSSSETIQDIIQEIHKSTFEQKHEQRYGSPKSSRRINSLDNQQKFKIIQKVLFTSEKEINQQTRN